MPDQHKYISKLAGARILIIGGSSGIGFAVAEASIEYGAAAVVISSSNTNRINTAISQLRGSYPTTNCQVAGFPCDLKQEDSIESNIATLFDAATLKGTQMFDHIVFTAGDQVVPKHVSQVNFEFIKETGLVRFFAAILVAKHAAKHLTPGPASSITLTSGIGGHRPLLNWNALSAYLASLSGLTRSLAIELKPVRVNVVCAGPLDTDGLHRYLGDASLQERQKSLDAIATKSLTGVIGKADDVAEAYMYCMKDHNLTGTAITSDSGHSIV
ncbi:NAD(P)-binding protein [Cadophora sp. DSE1049]|nr:NAD(P)-binding protein [Cadophora sp. DSE1049]